MRSFTTLALSVVTAGAALVIGAGPAQAIAHGDPVDEGNFPFAAKLAMTGIPNPDGTTRDSGCSGALVAPGWILTAGHCFHDVEGARISGPVPYDTAVTLGRVEADGTGGVDTTVVEVQQSPVNDIALARIAEPVTDIEPLMLAAIVPEAGEELRMTGWGALDGASATPADHLRTGLFTIGSVAESTLGVTGTEPASDTSACLLDSGAPYFRMTEAGPEVVATESTGPGCPHGDEETTARVDVAADWIAETIGQR